MSTTHPLEIAAARGQWHPQGAYLNTASYGLPPDCAWDAMQSALEDWRGGRTSWEHWGDSTEGARAAFAAIAGVEPETVATAATVSDLVGLVAPAELADAVDGATDVVAFSAVQMATGEVCDLEAIRAAAETHGAMTVVDATQGIGWLPLDASRFDVVVCHAYKWLMSPR